MTALPDAGFAFNSWQRVSVFTLSSLIIEHVSGSVDPITNVNVSVIRSPGPSYFAEPLLPFTMQAHQVLYSTNGNTLTQSIGWQADFVPIPEPSALLLTGFAIAVAALFRHQGFHCGREQD